MDINGGDGAIMKDIQKLLEENKGDTHENWKYEVRFCHRLDRNSIGRT